MRKRKRDFAGVATETAVVSLAYGGVNTVVALETGNPAQLSDAIHTFTDAFAHLLHRYTHTSEKYAKVFQALAGAAIAGGAIYTGHNSLEAAMNPDPGFEPIALGFEVGSVGMNGYYLSESIQSTGDSRGRAHGIWHNATDTALSSVAVVGISFNEVTGGKSEAVAGLIISAAALVLATMVAFDKDDHHIEPAVVE